MNVFHTPKIAAGPIVMSAAPWRDHGLLDSGGGRKLERYGRLTVIRPEPQCLWDRSLGEAAWAAADATFEPSDEEEAGRWRFARAMPESWPMAWRDVRFHARFTAFRHLAVFPEQASNWEWLDARLAASERPLSVLNLFGYTGVASLVAAARKANVTHVDASKKAVGWARENAVVAGLAQAPVRWICEDARKWVAREVRRGAR